jgi:hypothetical protein
MECKVAGTAPISVSIQKYTKVSTELNLGEKDSLYHWLRLLKNLYVFGLLEDEHVPKNPKCNGTNEMYRTCNGYTAMSYFCDNKVPCEKLRMELNSDILEKGPSSLQSVA